MLRKQKSMVFIPLFFWIALVLLPSLPVFAASSYAKPEMRVGYKTQSFAQMSRHSSAYTGAEKGLSPYKVNTEGEQICFRFRQKVPKGTTARLKLVDTLDSCLNYSGCSIRIVGGTSCTDDFQVKVKTVSSGTSIVLTAKDSMVQKYSKKTLTIEVQIVCTFRNAATASAHDHRIGDNTSLSWVIGNRVTRTFDGKNRAVSNCSYLYGDLYGSKSTVADTESSAVVTLCTSGGKVWKTIDNSSGLETFPSYYGSIKKSANTIGWSTKKNQTKNPEFVEGDRIPEGSGTYYAVTYTQKSPNGIPSVYSQTSDVLYFVGDSRTVGLKWVLIANGLLSKDTAAEKNKALDGKVEFICAYGVGLDWFYEEGLAELEEKLEQNSGKTQAIIFNLGVNDGDAYWEPDASGQTDTAYSYFSDLPETVNQLKAKYGELDFYYLSINPLNNRAMTKLAVAQGTRKAGETSTGSLQRVITANSLIRERLCSGTEKCFTYINAYSWLMKNGWCYDKQGSYYDGIHYSCRTYIHIYNLCLIAAGYEGVVKG